MGKTIDKKFVAVLAILGFVAILGFSVSFASKATWRRSKASLTTAAPTTTRRKVNWDEIKWFKKPPDVGVKKSRPADRPVQIPRRRPTTTRTTTLWDGMVRNPVAPIYSGTDSFWLGKHHLHKGNQLPRVLMYVWCNPSWLQESYVNFTAQIHRLSCYAHAHGFDVVLSDEQKVDKENPWPMFKHLGEAKYSYPYDRHNDIAWTDAVRKHLSSGEYDYLFLIKVDALIQERFLDFPVWAFDRGHDVTLMDQYHFLWPDDFGLNMNSILFKASDLTQRFLTELFTNIEGFHLSGANGAFMETILTFLGYDAEEAGLPGYNKDCLSIFFWNERYTKELLAQKARGTLMNEYFNQCFFQELERLTGVYGSRTSKSFGFTPTFFMHNGAKVMPSEVPGKFDSVPWANCHQHVRKWWSNPEQNCFAMHWNATEVDAYLEDSAFKSIRSQCPDTSFNWKSSDYNLAEQEILWRQEYGTLGNKLTHNPAPMYAMSDGLRFGNWKASAKWTFARLPRVLIYTWCTEDTFTQFPNEVYWKSCYAHAHGFDIVFTSSRKNFSAKEDNTWPWVHELQQYLSSKQYDYVLVMKPEVLIQESNFEFPVWEWNRGHDITMMDSHHFASPNSFGMNQNNVLFKASDFTTRFLNTLLEYRTGNYLQGDTGPFMEVMLKLLGESAKTANRSDYDTRCSDFLKLQGRSDENAQAQQNQRYSECFFYHLDPLAGRYGHRNVDSNIGFTPLFIEEGGIQRVPSDVPSKLGPWADCWNGPRGLWTLPEKNCFAFRWNRTEASSISRQVKGTCPDPSFNWNASPFNPLNRKVGSS